MPDVVYRSIPGHILKATVWGGGTHKVWIMQRSAQEEHLYYTLLKKSVENAGNWQRVS